jgi:pilus assembly protein Flp/PilA
MRILTRTFRSIQADERGATAAEYALIASLIAVVIVAAVILLGGAVSGLFSETASSFSEF